MPTRFGSRLRPVTDLGHPRRDVAHVRDQCPLEAAGSLRAEVGDPAVIGAVERILEPHVAERAVAGDVRGIEDVDVHQRAVHVLQAGLDVPAHLGPDRRKRIHASRRERHSPPRHGGPPGQPEGVATPEGPPGLDRLHDRGPAAEERVRVARLRLSGDGAAELLVGVVIGGVEVVAVETIHAFHDVGIEVDHRGSVPAHVRPLSVSESDCGRIVGAPP